MFQIDGTLEASVHYEEWPIEPTSHKHELLDLLTIINAQNLTIRGSGVVDGLGYDWWDREWNLLNKHGRPKLLEVRQSNDMKVYGLEFRNSPSWFINMGGVNNVHIKDIELDTNMLKQQ